MKLLADQLLQHYTEGANSKSGKRSMLSDEHVTVSHHTKKMRTRFGLYSLVLGLAILIGFVNPSRNALTADDR